MPLEGVVLQLKSMNVETILNFPFLTLPNEEGLRQAENLLIHLEALYMKTRKITYLGLLMIELPLFPRYSKM
jgi:ATP-dependent RNA helicase DHX37/DHR1